MTDPDSQEATEEASTGPAEEKTALAEDRTGWAYERTLLANDRTFSAWIRTGLTTLAVGFGVTRLLTEVQPAWLIPALGVLFVLVGGCIFFMGYWTHQKTLRKLAAGRTRRITGWVVGVITAALGIGAFASLWLIT